MSKKRVFISGDEEQLRTFNFDILPEVKELHLVVAPGAGKSIYMSRVVANYIKYHETHHLKLFPGAGMSFYVAKPDADLNMPEIGQKLLPFILPRKLRAAVAGDLAEDFRTYATRWGRPYALRWLWWELAGLCIRRFGPSAIITAVGLWCRQKLGW
jgi:hypothetical protein